MLSVVIVMPIELRESCMIGKCDNAETLSRLRFQSRVNHVPQDAQHSLTSVLALVLHRRVHEQYAVSRGILVAQREQSP